MTVIAAARKNNKITMAADSLATIGQSVVIIATPKIKKYNDILIGISGTCGRNDLLAATISSFIQECQKENKQWDLFWPNFCLSAAQYSSLDRLDSKEDSSALVVESGKIFQVAAGGSIFECGDDFLAIGSGRDYALGAMDALWDKYKDPEIIAQKAVEASCRLNAFCGLPVVSETIRLKEDKNEQV